MKKLIIAITLLLVFALSSSALAEGVEVYASKTFNLNSYSLVKDGEPAEIPESMTTYLFDEAPGLDIGTIYWLNDKVGLGVGVEGFENSQLVFNELLNDNLPVYQRFVGIYGSLHYSLFKHLDLHATGGFYKMQFIGEVSPTVLVDAVTFRGYGFAAGADVCLPIFKNLSIFGTASYRYAMLNMTEVNPLGGVSLDETVWVHVQSYVVGGGVSLSF